MARAKGRLTTGKVRITSASSRGRNVQRETLSRSKIAQRKRAIHVETATAISEMSSAEQQTLQKMQTYLEHQSSLQDYSMDSDDDDTNRFNGILTGEESIGLSHEGGEFDDIWMGLCEDLIWDKR